MPPEARPKRAALRLGVRFKKMNDHIHLVAWWTLLIATILAAALGALIVTTFFTGHYLDFALPIVKMIYGTQESVPVAYDKGLRLCFICAAIVITGTASIAWIRMTKADISQKETR